MSIKPVDFQISVPRTAEASKVRGDEQHKEISQQQMQAGATQNKVDNSLRQVQKRNQAEEARIKEKEEKEKREGSSERKKEENEQSQEINEKNVIKNKTCTFDVKI